MIKKQSLKWVIIISLLFGLTSCDLPWEKKSSDEAKELMKKILQVIGIPQDIIVNICQDENKNGFCESAELQSKLIVTLNQGETVWEKVKESEEGRYFLETYDHTLPILLELQDAYRVDFNDAKFTLLFDGFETKKQKELKELSVLQSMIDATHLSKNDAKGIRNLGNDYAQDKFYEYLFQSLETNLNNLGIKGFAPHEAMAIDIKKMATKLIEKKITTDLPKQIQECTNNECIDKALNVLETALVIDENEEIEDERIEVK